jgi:hypothetical protein
MKKLSLATAALCAFSANALADETLKLRTVIHATNLQRKSVILTATLSSWRSSPGWGQRRTGRLARCTSPHFQT